MPSFENCLVIIPARMASTRLPGKPLADIHGVPMIAHVWRRAMEANLGRVVVAAAEDEIVQAIKAVGGEAVLTDPAHPSGSDRVYEAVSQIDPNGLAEVIVNVQGDLPTLDPALIRQSVLPLEEDEVDIATLACPITDEAERQRSSVVKAAIAWQRQGRAGMPRVGRALYFSRSPIPWGEGQLWHHIGLYAYRRGALQRFVNLSPGELERRESLEQLRALENGMRIDAVEIFTVPLGVDTPEDLTTARKLLGGCSP